MSDISKAWPFETWLRIAVLQMHMTPENFWQMAVRDWFALLRPVNPTHLNRMDFQELFQTYPDEEIDT